MNKILFVLTFTLPVKVFAQCDSMPIVYNHIQKESVWSQREDLNNYEPKIEFIGYPQDSIYVGINSSVKEQLFKHQITFEFRTKNKIEYSLNSQISIRVCNSNIVKMSYLYRDSTHFEQKILNCYSVIIKNIDSFPIYISTRKILPIALEIEENDGTWRTLFEESGYGCATGDANYFIKPNEIVIVTVPIIPNNKKKHRFRIGKTYSNAFYQNINLN